MKIKPFIVKSLIISSLVLFAVLVSSSALAIDNPEDPGIPSSAGKPRDPGKSGNMLKPGDKLTLDPTGSPKGDKDKSKNKLTDAKLKVCKTKEKNIKTQTKQLGDLALNMQEKFDAIMARVVEYYTTTVKPSGKTVPNYDSLVAEVTTKKAVVKVAMDKSKSDIEGFSCDANDPKAQMESFKVDMKAVKAALQDYRTSIKNLIVAVRSVSQGGTE